MIFAVLKLPKEIWLLDKEELKLLNLDDIFLELEVFRNIFDHDKAGLFLRVKNLDYIIEIENDKIISHGFIYPLS